MDFFLWCTMLSSLWISLYATFIQVVDCGLFSYAVMFLVHDYLWNIFLLFYATSQRKGFGFGLVNMDLVFLHSLIMNFENIFWLIFSNDQQKSQTNFVSFFLSCKSSINSNQIHIKVKWVFCILVSNLSFLQSQYKLREFDHVLYPCFVSNYQYSFLCASNVSNYQLHQSKVETTNIHYKNSNIHYK